MDLVTRRGRLLLWVAASLLALALLRLAARGADWHGAIVAAGHARASVLILAIGANAAILVLWAALWRTVLPRAASVSYGRMFEIAAVTSAIMNTIPALVGHASAAALLVKRGGLPVRTAGTVIALDQLGEGLSKLAVLAIALALAGLPPWMIGAAASVAGIVALLVAIVGFLGWSGGAHFGQTRTGRILEAVRADLQVLRAPGRATAALATALAMKAAEAAAIGCVILALGIETPISSAFVILGAVNLATMLPVAPGNIGTYEAGAVAAYRWLGIPPDLALAAAVLQHACFLIPAIGTGVGVLAVTSMKSAGAGLRAAG